MDQQSNSCGLSRHLKCKGTKLEYTTFLEALLIMCALIHYAYCTNVLTKRRVFSIAARTRHCME